MKDFFKEVFAYHHHFNQLLADEICAHKQILTEEAYKIFCHILNAHQVWNSRILSEVSLKVWELHEPEGLKVLDARNYEHTSRILDKTDLNAVISYTNSKGEAYTNVVKDILFHINNHSTYHKGQIATAFRIAGLTPLTMDYALYKR